MFQRPGKIALIYAIIGGAFGLVWGLPFCFPFGGAGLIAVYILFGSGVPFLSALALRTWYVMHRGLVALDASRPRLAASALIVIAAYPVSLFSLTVPLWFASLLQGAHYWLSHARNLAPTVENYSLCFCAIVASLMIWVALSVALKQWNGRPLAQLLVSGILAAALFSAIETSRIGAQFELAVDAHGWNPWPVKFSILFVVGQSLFSAICGYAIASHSRSVEALRANRVS